MIVYVSSSYWGSPVGVNVQSCTQRPAIETANWADIVTQNKIMNESKQQKEDESTSSYVLHTTNPRKKEMHIHSEPNLVLNHLGFPHVGKSK